MQRLVRHTRSVRLLARAMAVLFAFVTIWGSVAHSCERTHGTHTHELAAEQGGTRGAAATQDGQMPTSERQDGAHPCCADLQCHVGSAIMTSGNASIPVLPAAERFVIADQAGESWFLSSLDRPPRHFLQN